MEVRPSHPSDLSLMEHLPWIEEKEIKQKSPMSGWE
jgi:hypothetical protein